MEERSTNGGFVDGGFYYPMVVPASDFAVVFGNC
jgi:hypothetical protein